MSRSQKVTMSWDLDAAFELAELLEREGRRLNDRGWLDDAAEIHRQIGLASGEAP